MDINNIVKLKMQLIINNNLYKRNVIDENTFSLVNDFLLKKLRMMKL